MGKVECVGIRGYQENSSDVSELLGMLREVAMEVHIYVHWRLPLRLQGLVSGLMGWALILCRAIIAPPPNDSVRLFNDPEVNGLGTTGQSGYLPEQTLADSLGRVADMVALGREHRMTTERRQHLVDLLDETLSCRLQFPELVRGWFVGTQRRRRNGTLFSMATRDYDSTGDGKF